MRWKVVVLTLIVAGLAAGLGSAAIGSGSASGQDPSTKQLVIGLLNVAKRHRNVIFLHQGGLKTAPNLGTYFGTIWQTQYAVGVAAGLATKTNKLGYVVAFPIAQTLENINAFERGAKSVNPNAKTYVVFTGNWCDPGKQAEAANSLLDQHIDVMAQHQDCTKTIVQTAERRGAM